MDIFHSFEGRVSPRHLARARLTEAQLDARVRRHDAAHRELLVISVLALVLGGALLAGPFAAFKAAVLVLGVSALAAFVYGLAPDAPEAPLARHPLLTAWALEDVRLSATAATWRDAALKQRQALRRFDAFAIRELACRARQPAFNPALAALHTPGDSTRSDA